MEFPEELDISPVLNVLYFYEYRVEIDDTIEEVNKIDWHIKKYKV